MNLDLSTCKDQHLKLLLAATVNAGTCIHLTLPNYPELESELFSADAILADLARTIVAELSSRGVTLKTEEAILDYIDGK